MLGFTVGMALQALLISSTAAYTPLSSDQYWKVQTPLNYSDVLYAGWPQIPVASEVEVYNGVSFNRTYAHHPALLAVNQTVYIIHSSSVIDEDMLGQEIWGSISHDGGVTWAESHPILPAALLPNQTSVANFSYWCNEAIWQRAFEGLAILEVEDEVWAVGETSNFFCWGTIGSGTHGAGRVARQLSSGDGGVIGDPCWLDQNNWTTISGYPGTIYGTEYNMSFCEKVDEMNAILDAPATVPAYSAWLYNNELFSLESRYYMQENTNAVWFEGDEEGNAGYWQRFWRDITSTNNSEAVWSEITYDAEGKDWYPVLEEQYGNDIIETNIPDAKTKQFLGVLNTTDRYLISNPRFNTGLIRQPLTIAMSRGANQSYTSVGVLRTNASDDIVADTRDYKNQGFSYPVAVQVGNKLVAAYSENKQNIWVSVVDIDELPDF